MWISMIEAVILFVFSIPVVMKYRILPVEGTPYWLFGLLFIILGVNLMLSYFLMGSKRNKYVLLIKAVLVIIVMVIALGGPLATSIIDRSKTAPVYGVHDIVLQLEAAMRYTIEGKNPYKETYFGTPLEIWHYAESGKPAVNPALYHFVMPPWYLLFPFFFYFFSMPILGYFDARMPVVFCAIALGFVLYKWFKRKEIGLLSIPLVLIAPGVVDYTIEGRSDLFALFWLVFALYLLDRGKQKLSGIIFALALLSKQTIWFSFPFYIVLLWFKNKQKMRPLITPVFFLFMTTVLMLIPFVFWDARSFMESVIFYLTQGGPHGYPISGYGLGMMLYEFKFISDVHSYYPFMYWQLFIGIPIFFVMLKVMVKRCSISMFFFGYALTLFVVWYLSRYFNNSHLTYLGTLFTLAGLKRIEEEYEVHT